MKERKKLFIIISILLFIILLVVILFSFFHKKESSTHHHYDEIPIKSKKDTSNTDIKNNIEVDSNNNEKTEESNNDIVNNYEDDSNKSSPTTYYCPDGFSLENDQCIQRIDANYVCPENTYDYSNDNIPRDKYCVNLSDGYETDTDSCPDNYGIMSVISIGQPTVYKCLVLYSKIYTCEDGYNLSDTNCIKQIPAEMR